LRISLSIRIRSGKRRQETEVEPKETDKRTPIKETIGKKGRTKEYSVYSVLFVVDIKL